MANFVADLTRNELLQLHNLVVKDMVALDKWRQIVPHICDSAADQLRIISLLQERLFEDAVLSSLQILQERGHNAPNLVNIFRDHRLNRLARNVEELFAAATESSTLWFEVGQVVHNFTGRRAEMLQLHIMITQDRSTDSMDGNMVCISGLGGVGKTMLAKKYAYNHRSFYDGNVIWINAESYDTMWNSFMRLAKYLGVPFNPDDPQFRSNTPGAPPTSSPRRKYFAPVRDPNALSKHEDKYGDEFIAHIYRKFSGKKCLFIFDNVSDKPNFAFEKFKPVPSRPEDIKLHYLLVTSRRSDFAPNRTRNLALNVLTSEETVELIQKELPDCNLEQAKSLGEVLQSLPLALQQALAYINDNYINANEQITHYLSEFSADSARLLDDRTFQDHDIYTRTVMTTWNITIRRIAAMDTNTSKDALKLMNSLSYLNPDNISVQFLNKLFEKNVESSLKILQKFSMINIETSGQSVSIHRLVQEVFGDVVQHLLVGVNDSIRNSRFSIRRGCYNIRQAAYRGPVLTMSDVSARLGVGPSVVLITAAALIPAIASISSAFSNWL